MALQVWLPLNKDLINQGLSNISINNTGTTIDNNGKIGKCFKITAEKSLGYTPNFNDKGLSLCGWFKFNQSEINAIISTQTYDSTWNSCSGNLIGNNYYGGIGLIWQTNNIYSSGSLTSITIKSILRTSATVSKLTSGFDIEFDKWIHIALTWDPNTHVLSLYKDGILFNSVSNIATFTDGASRVLYISYKGAWGGNPRTPVIPIYENDIRVYDHCLSPKEVHEISQGLVLHYKLDTNDISLSPNLITGFVNGGQTTISGNNIVISGNNSDTYFKIKTSKTLTLNKQYKLSCIGTGFSNNSYYNFPIAGQSNTSQGVIKIQNGYCELIFIANEVIVNAGTTIILDDAGRSPSAGTITNIILQEYTDIIYDCSGYQHHGKIIDQLNINNDSLRYNNCIKNTSEYPCKTITSIDFPESSGLTICCWVNLTAWGHQISGLWATSNLSTDPTDFNTTACNHRDSGFDMRGTNGTTYRLTCNSTDIPINTWKHVTITHDGANAKLYINGVLIRTKEIPSSLAAFKYVYLGYSKAGGSIRKCQGNWSDFRIYATSLSDEDILALYNNPANIDNKGNMFSFEFDEEDVNKQQILENGITKINDFIEINDKIKVLDDGSVFLQILHHNNPASNLFTVSNCWLNNDENLYSAIILLKNVFKNLTEYEFLACEKIESTSTEAKIRWKQTSNPAISSTLSGYTLISGSPGRTVGLMNKGTYGCFHNGGSWWCCCGSYTGYQGGIPGFNGVVKSGYLDLYIRISEEMLKGEIGDNLKFFKKSILSAQIIEK